MRSVVAERDNLTAELNHDALTQAFSLTRLNTNGVEIFEDCKQVSGQLAVAVMDIDHFKLVNDNFGHIVGDEVLKEVAKIIKESIRKVDTAGRWGGEEFMIVLPDSDLDVGRILAEKIRTKIESNDFSKVGRLTASFGVAEFKDGISEIEFVNRADNAMYQAKNQGRNKVCVS